MDLPLVSIIVPVYNSELYLQKAIDSVRAQTYAHWELILVDDGSEDASLEIAYKNQKDDARIVVLAMAENQGAGVARNLGTDKAKGVYMAFLDADDLWLPAKLAKQIEFMQTYDAGVSFTSYAQIDKDGVPNNLVVRAMGQLSELMQKSNNYIGNLTGMYSIEKLGKIHAPVLRKRQDWALWHKAIKQNGAPALGLDKVLAQYRRSNASMSANKRSLVGHNYHFYKSYLGYSSARSVLWMAVFFWHYFIRRPRYIKHL